MLPGGLDVLEIGCGKGGKLRDLKAVGNRVVGIDPDEIALEIARDRGVDTYWGTAESIPDAIREMKFNAVIFSHVLEHCIDPDLALENAKSALKPGGTCVIEVPNNACLGIDHFGRQWHFLDIPRHLNFFTQESLTDICTRHGFDVEKVDFHGYCRHFNADWASIQNTIAKAFGEKPHGLLSYARYLLKSISAPAAKKYDSVRVIATLN